jgi:hypothetical protein
MKKPVPIVSSLLLSGNIAAAAAGQRLLLHYSF